MTKINLMPKKSWKTKAFKSLAIVAQVALIFQMSSLGVFLVPTSASAANPSANLDQCANDPAPSPSTDGCSTSSSDWVNGNLNQSKSVYYEGDSIPYRMLFDSLSLDSHTVTIEWDTTKGGKHAIDYITTYNRTVATANPCLGVSGCSASTTFPIPADPQVTGASVTPIAGNFTLFGGTITGVSVYSYLNGTGFLGDKSARITLTFTASVANPVLAWGGHISHRNDWGTENSAVAISGSPYHTRLIDLDGSGGNQDRSLSAEAVIYPASITIVKDATPEGPQNFDYTATGGLSPSTFSLVDDGTLANTQAYNDLINFSTYSITETTVSGWDLTGITCVVTTANGGTQTVSLPTVTIDIEEGENVSCTFTNDRLPGSISGYKWKDINGNGIWEGGEPALAGWQINLSGALSASTTTNANGYYEFTNLNPGNYNVSETQKLYWIQTYPANNIYDINLSAGQNVTDQNFGNKPGTCQLNITKSVDKTDASVGDTLTYTINYSNDGTDKCTGTGVKIYDPLNIYLDYVAGSKNITITNDGGNLGTEPGQGDDYNGKANTLLFNVREVVPGEYGVITFQATVNTPEVCCDFRIPNKAKIWSNETGDKWSNEVITNVHMDCHATLKVIKHVINDNGGTKVASDFTMNVIGTNVSDPSFPGSETGTEVTLETGSFSVDENYMAGYAKSFSGDCSGTISNGDYKVCTVTNNDIAPKLKLIKHVINNNGGTKVVADFPLFIDATQVTSGSWNTVSANVQLTASETTNPGYEASLWSGDCNADGTITLFPGDQKVCEITNDDKEATLTLIKHVVNDNGGTKVVSSFPLFIDATQVTSGVANSVPANIQLTASEISDPGYAASDWSGDCNTDGTITLQPGDNKLCEITNNDIAPKLKLIKHVVNDNGGTKVVADFPLFIDASQVTSGRWNAVMANTQLTASETEDPGYAASEWTGDCNRNGTITLQPGDEKICYITNDDIQPKLTVIKHVINDFGGTAVASDFRLYVTANNASPDSFDGSESGTLVTLDQGRYDVTEGYFPGYTPVFSADCTGTINVGEEKTCTVTNSSELSHLIVIKDVINDNGGDKDASDFQMTIHGVTAQTGNTFPGQEDPGTNNIVTPGTYWVTETELTGYTPDYSADCTGNIALGETKICTITNNDISPKLKLVKYVTNDNGGTKQVADFALYIDGNSVTSGQWNNVLANTEHTASETEDPGYAAYLWGGDCNIDGTITLQPGDQKICYITNDDIAPTLKLVKNVTTDNGGNETAVDWTLYATGNQGFNDSGDSATFHTVLANEMYTLSENGPAGYSASGWSCNGGSLVNGNELTLNVNEYVTCEITNDDQAPTITLIKEVINDNNGDALPDDFKLTIGGAATLSGVAMAVDANTPYALDETQLAGYSFVSLTGDAKCPAAIAGEVTLDEGENITCTITNDDEQSYIIVNKTVINDNGGSAVADDFLLTVDGNAVFDEIAYPVNPGTHTAGETTLPGYTAGAWGGDCDVNADVTVALGETKTCTITNDDIPIYKINLIKTDSPDPVSPGGFITYTMTWSVAGNTKVTNLTLTDPLPANTLFSSVANGGVYDDTTKTVTWNLGEKNPGDSGTVTYVVKALANLHNGTIITNIATLDSSETEPVEASANTTITSAPILNIEKTVDLAYANPGNVVTYTVVVSNTGNETAYEVVLTDTLPAGFTFNPEGTATKSWSLGDLLPGGSKTVNYEVTVGKSVIAGFYDNLAEAVAKNHGKVSDIATVEVRIPKYYGEEAYPQLTIGKTVDKDSVNPNSLVNYTVTISNKGEATAYNVILTDKLPAGFTFTDTGLNEKTWTLGDMTPGSSLTLNYEVLVGKDVKAGDYLNQATVKADNNDPITAKVNVNVKQGVVLGITGPKWYEIFYYLLGLLFVLGGLKSYRMLKKQEIQIQ
ncbi:MAG: SdrD B-like domain-containing protein [Patescibacteria group bacterium]